jgi:hypothetical protein
MKWLVFSKDRPYQLDAFLRTARDNAGISLSDVSVLYRYTGDFEYDIEVVKSENPNVNFISQSDFRSNVISWIDKADADVLSFATDDALFTRHVPTSLIRDILVANKNITTFSLRMGLHLEHCYPTNSPQRIPDGQIQNGVFIWSAESADGDWGYPLSVDGHVFRRDFVKSMFEAFDFSNPNSLESNWQLLRHAVSPITCCLPKSCYFNVPLNRVQIEYVNRCGTIDNIELLNTYRSSMRFVSTDIRDFINISAHQEVKII